MATLSSNLTSRSINVTDVLRMYFRDMGTPWLRACRAYSVRIESVSTNFPPRNSLRTQACPLLVTSRCPGSLERCCSNNPLVSGQSR